jgi:hypothetical protein
MINGVAVTQMRSLTFWVSLFVHGGQRVDGVNTSSASVRRSVMKQPNRYRELLESGSYTGEATKLSLIWPGCTIPPFEDGSTTTAAITNLLFIGYSTNFHALW